MNDSNRNSNSNSTTLAPMQLVGKDFVQEMFTPQSPEDCPPGYPADQKHMCSQYSFLAYVATNNSAPAPGKY